MLGGFAAQVAGLAAWHGAHRRQGSPLLFWAGLALLLCSAAVMIGALGWALGLSWALLTLSLAAYLPFLLPLLRTARLGAERDARRVAGVRAARGGRLGLALRLLSAGPLYLLAALAVGCVLATRLPWDEVNRLMAGGLTVPAVWAAGALHATADLRLWRVLGVPVAVAGVFAAGFFLL